MKKKIDFAAEADANVESAADKLITDDHLLEACPAELVKRFKAAKTPAARADLLYSLSNGELKELRQAFKEMDDFVGQLEAWFIQELANDQTGVAGRLGRVEIKRKEIATVEDWSKFYEHIRKKKEFDLLNRAVNQKAVKERWEQAKDIPGVGRFVKKSVSITAVKGK
jgi:hypothetical protein